MNNDINKVFDEYYKEDRLNKKIKNNIKQFIVKSVSIPLAMGLISANSQYLYDKKMKLVSNSLDNPFNGSKIIVDDEKINENYNELKKYIDQDNDFFDKTVNDMSLSEKSKQLLLYAFYSNKKIDIKNLNVIKNYLCYLEDNPYSNYEEAYNNLKTLFVIYDKTLPSNVAGTYTQLFNTILIQDEEFVSYAYLHELLHMDSRSGVNANLFNIAFTNKYYNWFEEGSAEVLASEYRLSDETVYPVSSAAVRLLTRILGCDVIYKARRDTHEILIEELEKKGIERDDIISLFDLLNKNTTSYNSDEIEEIVNYFLKIYKIIYKEDKFVDPLYVFDLYNIRNCNPINFKYTNYYLFNKKYNKNNVIDNIKVESADGKKIYYIKTIYYKDHCMVYDELRNENYERYYKLDNLNYLFSKRITKG